MDGESVLGVNLAAGVAYLGLVECPGRVLEDGPVKIAPPSNVDELAELHQFGERVLAEAQARGAVSVVFVEPRKFGGWKYYEAHRRGALQTAVGLALRSTDIRMESIAQRTIAAAFGCKGLGELDRKLPAVLGVAPAALLHWKERGIALAAALCHARRLWS